MKALPEQHKLIAQLFGVVLLFTAVAYIFFVRPLWADVLAKRNDVSDKETKLKKTGWIIDSSRLEVLQRERQKQLEKITSLSDEVLKQTTSMFQRRLQAFYAPNVDFRNSVSRIDFQIEFDQFRQQMRGRGIILAEEKLGIGENSESPYTYELMLQLWTLEDVMNIVLNHHLRVAQDPKVRVPTEGGRFRRASDISVLPIQAYYLNKSDKEPYVIEIPIRIVLYGSIANVAGFLRALHDVDEKTKKPRFYPISQMELWKVPPDPKRPAADVVRVKVICSAFFRTGVKISGPVAKNVNVPKGV